MSLHGGFRVLQNRGVIQKITLNGVALAALPAFLQVDHQSGRQLWNNAGRRLDRNR
jgi:hypothetical protein